MNKFTDGARHEYVVGVTWRSGGVATFITRPTMADAKNVASAMMSTKQPSGVSIREWVVGGPDTRHPSGVYMTWTAHKNTYTFSED